MTHSIARCTMRCLQLLAVSIFLSNASWAAEVTGQPRLVLDSGGHNSYVNKLLFTPDGRELVSVSVDKTIRMWDTLTGEALRVLRPPIGNGSVGKLSAAVLSSDGKTLAVAGVGGGSGTTNPIYVIALPSGTIERILTGHDRSIWSLAFSPNGELLVSGSNDASVRLWDVATGKCTRTLKEHADLVYGLDFSPDGQYFVSVSKDGTGRIWSVKSGEPMTTFDGHKSEIRCVEWSPDGETIATGGTDNSIRLWDSNGILRKSFKELGNSISSVTFTPDGKQLLITRSGEGTSHDSAILDLETGNESVQFKRHDNDVEDGTLSPNGLLAATTGGRNQAIWIWKTSNADAVARLSSQGKGVYSAAWSKDGQYIAWGNGKGEGANDLTATLEKSFSLTDLEFGLAPDNSFRRAQLRIGSVSLKRSDDRTIAVRRDGDEIAKLKLGKPQEKLRCFTVAPNNRALVGSDLGFGWFDTVTGKMLHKCQGHLDDVFAVAPSPDNRYFLSASGDQTIRIWTRDGEKPLLSLFFTENEWVAWTPEGYFADSPGGAHLMGWHVNHGRDKMATFHPAGQFKASLYRPDVIKLLVKTGSVERALEEADKVLGKASEFQSVENLLPPFVEITTPDMSNTETVEDAVVVRFFAKAEKTHPIVSVRLMVNGRPYTGDQGVKTFIPPRDGVIRESWSVPLVLGENRFTVQAVSAVSVGSSDPVKVTRQVSRGLSKIDPAAEEYKTPLPSLYVLAIGVSDYPDKLKLNYAAVDAKALAAACANYSKELYKKVEIRLLTDEKATRRDILQGLTWMRRQMTTNDVGVLFFAGHGGKESDGSFYLFPIDVEPDDLLATGVPGDQIKKVLASIPGRFILMLDACHSGAVDGERRRSGGPLTDELVRDLATDDFGIVVMCSSMGSEFSLESAKTGHGLFTLALVEGLSGKAQRVNGAIYLHHLNAYVVDRVKELSNGRQHPVTPMPGSMRSFPLTIPPASAP